ncbi:MAG: glycine--tRNA ligase [Candidatus Micrarchaeia archaeon]
MKTTDLLFNLCTRRGIIIPAFKPYGELAGFYDYGPIGTRIKNNIINAWRNFFIEGLGNLEIDTSLIAPEVVFEASGHIKKFTDPVVKCKKCGTSYRADKLLAEFFNEKNDIKNAEKAKHETPEGLENMIKDNGLKCKKCGGELGSVELFNLMLATKIGPAHTIQGYLRPETAQSIFLDFKEIFQTYGLKLPIGIGTAGKAFRNEIAPRNILIRLREFSQMELEFFYDPEADNIGINGESLDDKALSEEINILSRESQLSGSTDEYEKVTIKECLDRGIFKNKLFAFLIYKEWKFASKLGYNLENARFRQLLDDELPHYSKGNFDLEVKLDGDYEEVMGNADRGNFDLSNHAEYSKQEQSIFYNGRKFVPSVIELSMGIDRIFWTLLAGSLHQDNRGWDFLILDRSIAPYEYAIFPLQKDEKIEEKARHIFEEIKKSGVSAFYSDSGSIGKRYAKADEIGIRYAITIDYDTVNSDGKVTVRDALNTKQERIKIEELLNTIKK